MPMQQNQRKAQGTQAQVAVYRIGYLRIPILCPSIMLSAEMPSAEGAGYFMM